MLGMRLRSLRNSHCLQKVKQMSIWTGKKGYNSAKDFEQRTKKVLEKKRSKSFRKDVGALDKDGRVVSRIRNKIKELDKPEILEVGCGYGRWSKSLEGLFSSYMGVDITKDRINYAIKNYGSENVEFTHVGGEWNLGKKFDVILSLMVIQHLTMPTAITLLKQIAKHLKPDGVVILHEGRLGYFTEKEAEKKYASDDCPWHMIYKPIGLLEKEVPTLKWHKMGGLSFELRNG